jgi:hypothetical protein
MDAKVLLKHIGYYVKLDGILWHVERVIEGFEDIAPALSKHRTDSSCTPPQN